MQPTRKRRTSRAMLLAMLILGARASTAQPTTSQSTESPNNPTFEPLDRWKAAVLAGDKSGLKGFYPPDPRAFAQTPEGKSTDPANEEPEFWSRLSSMGLTAIVPKVLEQTSPQPGVVSLVLRIELTFQSKNEARQSLVSAAQLWVGQGEEWHILVTQRGDVKPLPTIRLPEPKIPNTHLYPDSSEAHKDLDAALASAQVDHKRVLVIFGANWCYDCHVLDTALRANGLASLVAANYHVVHINIAEGESNADLAKRFQVPLDKGIPSLAVLNSEGQLITSQKQGEFESAAKIGMDDVREFLNRWKPEPTK
jgi:thioredoxin 1